jgi:hypothetical protein
LQHGDGVTFEVITAEKFHVREINRSTTGHDAQGQIAELGKNYTTEHYAQGQSTDLCNSYTTEHYAQ